MIFLLIFNLILIFFSIKLRYFKIFKISNNFFQINLIYIFLNKRIQKIYINKLKTQENFIDI